MTDIVTRPAPDVILDPNLAAHACAGVLGVIVDFDAISDPYMRAVAVQMLAKYDVARRSAWGQS